MNDWGKYFCHSPSTVCFCQCQAQVVTISGHTVDEWLVLSRHSHKVFGSNPSQTKASAYVLVFSRYSGFPPTVQYTEVQVDWRL